MKVTNLIATLVRDGAQVVSKQRPSDMNPNALEDAIEWLCRTHDATGRQGSSKGYSLLHGWLPAYPETTGYVLEVLLWHALRQGDRQDLVDRAKEMGDWEVSVQSPDGGIMEGELTGTHRRSVIFNTGQVLHGWMTLTELGHSGYEEAARRAARFLMVNMQKDGTWNSAVEYGEIPHTYNTRVAWAMLRYAADTGSTEAAEAASRHLNWAVDQQLDNGWFQRCFFKAGMPPSTHALAYTLRGLLESYAIVGEQSWLRAVERTSETMSELFESSFLLPAEFDANWNPTARHACLTGTAQLGGVWLRLYQITNDAQWLRVGANAVEQAASYQERSGSSTRRGAIAGSFPIWGRYAPLQYPNWATRFLAESLILYRDLCR